MPRKMTTTEFIERAKQVHGDKFLYDKVEYKTAWEKVLIGCREHGYFLQAPANHLCGAKCLRCRQERTGRANAITQEEFIAKSIEIHGAKYDYSKVIYRGCFIPVEIICHIHGSFFQIPNTHLTNHGCPRCAREIIESSRRKTTQEFIKDAIKIHGGSYDYSLVVYKNSHIPVEIICSKHGIFTQKPNGHLNGHGCPICKMSKGEIRITDALIVLGISFEIQKTFPNCKNKWRLRFDFYFEKNNSKFLVEYDGSQHFFGWSGQGKNLKRIQHHDAIKTKFAQDNGFILIRIPYTEFDNIEAILIAEIQKYAIP